MYISSFSLLQLTFNCILDRIEKQHNITCTSLDRNEARTLYAVDVYKGIPLKFQPDSCTLFLNNRVLINFKQYCSQRNVG